MVLSLPLTLFSPLLFSIQWSILETRPYHYILSIRRGTPLCGATVHT